MVCSIAALRYTRKHERGFYLQTGIRTGTQTEPPAMVGGHIQGTADAGYVQFCYVPDAGHQDMIELGPC